MQTGILVLKVFSYTTKKNYFELLLCNCSKSMLFRFTWIGEFFAKYMLIWQLTSSWVTFYDPHNYCTDTYTPAKTKLALTSLANGHEKVLDKSILFEPITFTSIQNVNET
jgi:hypothetical protein